MNDKKKSDASGTMADIGLGDLNALERELGGAEETPRPTLREARSNVFAFQNPKPAGAGESTEAAVEEPAEPSSRPRTPSIAKGLGGGDGTDKNLGTATPPSTMCPLTSRPRSLSFRPRSCCERSSST